MKRTVTQLAGNLGSHRHVISKLLNEIPRHHAGIIGSTAPDDHDIANITQFVITHIEPAKFHAISLGINAPTQCRAETVWLIVDFFQKKVIKPFFLDRLKIEFELLDFRFNYLRVDVIQLNALTRTHADFTIMQINHPVGIAYQRRSVTGDEYFILRYADDQRTAISSNNNLIWILHTEECNAIRADHHF